jgi:hypothetical protein
VSAQSYLFIYLCSHVSCTTRTYCVDSSPVFYYLSHFFVLGTCRLTRIIETTNMRRYTCLSINLRVRFASVPLIPNILVTSSAYICHSNMYSTY